MAASERAGVADPDVIPFSIADMDLITAPEIISALREAAEFGVYGYTSMDEAYRSAVAGWMRRRHGWEIQPGWIINAFGVVHAVGQAVQAFTQPGEASSSRPPPIPPFLRILQATGRTPLSNPLLRGEQGYTLISRRWRPCVPAPTPLLLFCPPTTPRDGYGRRRSPPVADICARNGVLLFSDEIHFDFIAPGHRHTVLATLDEQTWDNCIVGTSASKTFNLAGLSTANIIIPNDTLRRRFRAKTDGYTGGYTGYFWPDGHPDRL